ncbi:polysaccharide biosynthesis protein GtrA [Actinomyces sp. 432]|nr:GtrA family protein [Actinomyces sp. 432]QHO91480.1 polysaccharide biosynthesis protein GtrA [Actinomyces sp. 432]
MKAISETGSANPPVFTEAPGALTSYQPEPGTPPPAQAAPGEEVTRAYRPHARVCVIDRLLAWLRELTQFGLVGALAFIIDSGMFNLLQHGPTGVLAGHPNTANLVSAAVATVFSWVANRSWTYRGRTRESMAREAALFAFANAGGILITQFCLLFTHHILELTGPLADNVSAYVVGFALGTAFRFFFYHYVVFTGDGDAAPN